jgi:predicted metal-binding protein
MAPTLHVCVTCRCGAPPAVEEAVRDGQRLFDDLTAVAASSGLRLRPVECLANCARGCSAAISMPGKWSYLLGGLSPALAADLAAYAAAYAESRTGTVMPSRRAASLRGMIVGRIPSELSA